MTDVQTNKLREQGVRMSEAALGCWWMATIKKERKTELHYCYSAGTPLGLVDNDFS